MAKFYINIMIYKTREFYAPTGKKWERNPKSKMELHSNLPPCLVEELQKELCKNVKTLRACIKFCNLAFF